MVGALALFVVLTGGTAYAANTVFSSDIVNGEVKTADLANNAVRTGKVLNENLTGADIVESSLGEVPSARLRGLGGDTAQAPTATRELVAHDLRTERHHHARRPHPRADNRTGHRQPRNLGTQGEGQCHVGTNGGALLDSSAVPFVVDQADVISVSGVTDVVGPGPIAFGLDCNEEGQGGIHYSHGHLSFVELSPG